MEIKFFDRLKALEKLEVMSSNKENHITPFYEALKMGADVLSRDDVNNED